jgi:hypothetical protein
MLEMHEFSESTYDNEKWAIQRVKEEVNNFFKVNNITEDQIASFHVNTNGSTGEQSFTYVVTLFIKKEKNG